jgi:hypothetical protein
MHGHPAVWKSLSRGAWNLLTVSFRRLARSRQTWICLLLLAFAGLVVVAWGRRPDRTPEEFVEQILMAVFVSFLLPIYCLCYGAAGISAEREEETLVYILLSPASSSRDLSHETHGRIGDGDLLGDGQLHNSLPAGGALGTRRVVVGGRPHLFGCPGVYKPFSSSRSDLASSGTGRFGLHFLFRSPHEQCPGNCPADDDFLLPSSLTAVYPGDRIQSWFGGSYPGNSLAGRSALDPQPVGSRLGLGWDRFVYSPRILTESHRQRWVTV